MGAKKKNDKKADEAQVAAAPDPRQALPPGPESWALVLAELQAVVADLEVPKEPKAGDLFEAMLHFAFADGVACGIGQEAVRRIGEGFVDRNEFRVTEAYEVEDLLADLPIPGLFERCLWVREAVAQIYNDQNGLDLTFLREAGVSDRSQFFQRIPALPPPLTNWLTNLLTAEELVFSERSILRAQQRLGMEPKDPRAQEFVDAVRALLKPFGQLPLLVGKHLPSGRPSGKHVLCPGCCLCRLGPAGKRR